MTGDEMSVLFHDPHDLIDALEGRTVKACDDGCEAHGVLRRVTQRGEERDVGPGWSSPTIYMVDIVTPETGDLICRTDVRNFDLLEVVPVSDPTPSTDGAPDPEEVVDVVALTRRETSLLAARIVARHSRAVEDWLLWEDYPLLSQAGFEELCDAVRRQADDTLRACDRIGEVSGMDAAEIEERTRG